MLDVREIQKILAKFFLGDLVRGFSIVLRKQLHRTQIHFLSLDRHSVQFQIFLHFFS